MCQAPLSLIYCSPSLSMMQNNHLQFIHPKISEHLYVNKRIFFFWEEQEESPSLVGKRSIMTKLWRPQQGLGFLLSNIKMVKYFLGHGNYFFFFTNGSW